MVRYGYDSSRNANRLTRRTRTSNYVDYTYDAADQLTMVHGYETNEVARRHEWLGYGYASNGNLL